MVFSDQAFDLKIIRDIRDNCPAEDIFLKIKRAVSNGYSHTDYHLVSQLTDQIGPWYPRLFLLEKIVKMPSFTYHPTLPARHFLFSLAASSYWLDNQLFDESLFQKNARDTLPPEQQEHKKLLEIGSTLISKGFPLKDLMHDTNDPQPMVHWINTYIRQCYLWNKRPKQISHKRGSIPKKLSPTNGRE